MLGTRNGYSSRLIYLSIYSIVHRAASYAVLRQRWQIMLKLWHNLKWSITRLDNVCLVNCKILLACLRAGCKPPICFNPVKKYFEHKHLLFTKTSIKSFKIFRDKYFKLLLVKITLDEYL